MKDVIVERIHSFTFKSTSVGGDNCKFAIRVYVGKDNVIKVTKRFLSNKGDLPFHVLKKFKNKWLYEEVIAFKQQTMLTILMNSLQIIYPGHKFEINEKDCSRGNRS